MNKKIITLFVMLAVSLSAESQMLEKPAETKKLVDKMLAFHGGTNQWEKIKRLNYTHSLYINNFPKNLSPWWISHEAFNREKKLAYQFYPMENSTLVKNSKGTWHNNWKLINPPGMMPYFNYNFVVLPWLVTEPGAVVEYSGEAALPPSKIKYPTITLKFSEEYSQTPKDYFKLFIEPESGRLMGVEYNSTYAPLLDQMNIKANQFGPGYHVFEKYKLIGGLKVAERYKTYFGERLAGAHAITDLKLNKQQKNSPFRITDVFQKVTAHPTLRTVTQ